MKLVKILVKDDELPKSFYELVKTILTNKNDAIEQFWDFGGCTKCLQLGETLKGTI
jgi:hypothetical protein